MKLELRNISKSFDDNQVLNDFSMELDRGEIVVIQGPSGVGKTTVLRCINQLETIDEGSILLDGSVIQSNENGQTKSNKQNKSAQYAIGYVFQQYQLFPHMNVIDNLITAVHYHKLMTKEEAKNKAKILLADLNIADKENAYPYQLSGGQKQRVAIARACMLNPEILCFDEPTAALDPVSIEGVVSLIKDLASTGMGILIVSHDNIFASQVATRTITLRTA